MVMHKPPCSLNLKFIIQQIVYLSFFLKITCLTPNQEIKNWKEMPTK